MPCFHAIQKSVLDAGFGSYPVLSAENIQSLPSQGSALPGERLLSDIACGRWPRHDPRHGTRDRTKQPTLDLFSTAGPSRAPSPRTKKVSPTQEWRHVLPNDLPDAVRQLDDRELDQLITVSLEEAKRRGKLLPNTPNLALGQQLSKMANQRQRVEVAPVSLTRGQVNAIRAAAKAGIKPSVIARQFGIAQSDVRKVMASDTPGRGTRYG